MMLFLYASPCLSKISFEGIETNLIDNSFSRFFLAAAATGNSDPLAAITKSSLLLFSF